MSDNVFLFGAGASFDAGIPLLADFMDCMREMAWTGRSRHKVLSEEDQKILLDALDIRDDLESYHARVALDQFNIEQVMSVLAFDAFTRKSAARKALDVFTRAIATTINLSCNVEHDGDFRNEFDGNRGAYHGFWGSLLKLLSTRALNMPTILSFNYDLVLERALFQHVIGKSDGNWKANFPFSGLRLNYENPDLPPVWYKSTRLIWRGQDYREIPGLGFEQTNSDVSEPPDDCLSINFLKLHGSLNFPAKKLEGAWNPVIPQSDPRIIPPVFNKADSKLSENIWRSAMDDLRGCKNLIICGYSLPETDTYMQYFLKAALGPNRNLNRVYIFDPKLFGDSESGSHLQARYLSCFSPQMKSRLEFHPPVPEKYKDKLKAGTFEHMTYMLLHSPDSLLFGLCPDGAGKAKSQPIIEIVPRRRPNRRNFLI